MTGSRGHAEKEKCDCRQAGYGNHERHGAQTHGHRVMVHDVSVQEAAETSGQDEQSEDTYRRSTPPSLEVVTLSHGLPRQDELQSRCHGRRSRHASQAFEKTRRQ
jgi:hypothetical protein